MQANVSFNSIYCDLKRLLRIISFNPPLNCLQRFFLCKALLLLVATFQDYWHFNACLKIKKHHWDKDLSFDNNPLYVFLVKEKFKQQFDALKSRHNKHFPVFLSRISPSLNSARMRIFCNASTNWCSKSLYSHRKIDYFNTCKKNGRRCTYQLKSPSWITVWN